MKKRIVAFLDHEIGYRLLAKILAERDPLGLDLLCVVTTQENGTLWWPGLSEVCEQHGIPLLRYSEPFTQTFAYEAVDWYLLLSWKYVIPPDLISHPRLGAINMHYSLLPQDRGVYPVNWAIMQGRKETGVTFHRVNEKIDDGSILFQSKVAIRAEDTARTLQLRMDDVAFDLFSNVLRFVAAGAAEEPTVEPADAQFSYNSRAKFTRACELDLDRVGRTGDIIDLLRGMSFRPETRNVYFVDPQTGRRIYLTLTAHTDDT